MDHAGQRLELDRFLIRIRGPNPYLAWADSQGNLVRLLPLPVKGAMPGGLVREGYEKSAGALGPPMGAFPDR